ncbi:MAG TPA: TonB family protein [Gemmatimonadaceae bacterium]|nr:TonB family protein [Gemmatimonadaceae bacterium]
MMNNLLESKPKKQRNMGTTIFSAVFHSAILFFAIYATARAGIADDNQQREQKVNFVKVKPAEPPPPVEKKPEPPPPPKPKAPPKRTEHTPAPLPPAPKAEIAPPKGFKVLEAPVNIPTTIPTVDLSAKVTNEADFSGKGVAGGSSTGVEGSTGTKEGAAGGVDTNKNYAEFEVEQQVSAISGVSIPYPEGMRSSGVEGEVLAEFVVNENGRVETSTFKVLNSTNAMFTSAVKAALPRMRFRPAKIGSTNVSQVVQQAFVFKLNR